MASTMLIPGQRVVPKRAQEAGFTFTHPEIESALADAIKQ
jgi:NAD dependent epimerase/dehydratase family enzyme